MKSRFVTRTLSLVLILGLVLALSACGAAEKPAVQAAPAAEGQPGAPAAEAVEAKNIKDTIVVAVQYNPTGLDPTNNKMQDDFNIINALYDTLVARDYDTDEYLPRLATSWEWNTDTTMLFHLRDDVYFSNGEKLTAEDVAYSFITSCASADNKSFMAPFDPENTKALDENTVQIGFKYTFSGALAYIASSRGGIVCKAVHESVGGDAYAQEPIGSGMFLFDSWTQGDSVVLRRNDNYWDKDRMPAYETLIYRVITEASVRAAELESGGVDAAFSIVANDFSRLQQNPELVCLNYSGWTHSGLQFNAACDKFQDQRVREAICIALDIPAIVEAVYGEYGSPCSGVYPSAVQDFVQLGPREYNPERAKALLAEAGYPDGIDINVCLGHTGNITQCVTLAQEYWKQVGIRCTIDQMEVASMVERNNAGVNELSSTNTTVHSGTASDALKHWSSTWVGALHMNDPYVDEMLAKGQAAIDPAERAAVYKELQEYLWAGCYEIRMVFPNTLFVHSAKLSGLKLSPNDQIIDYSALVVEK